MPQNKRPINTQSGNVFVIIFIAVILFAALGFTFTKSANKGAGNLTKQQAKVAAQDILNYARLVESAVDRVRRNGCSESEISFENSITSDYTNPNSPVDNSCHIFNDAGGKISYSNPNPNYFDSAYIGETYNSGDNLWGEYVFHQGTCIKKGPSAIDPGCNSGGTSEQQRASVDLMMVTFYINKDICIALNTLLKNAHANTDPPQLSDSRFYTTSAEKYDGGFTQFRRAMTPAAVDRNASYCVEANSVLPIGPDTYHFYHVILDR